jgi:hypothetical protein
MNLKRFLRLQTDSYLTTLRDKVATELAGLVQFTSLSMSGKTVSQRNLVKVTDLADALAIVLIERGLQGSDYKEKTRMTLARFV